MTIQTYDANRLIERAIWIAECKLSLWEFAKALDPTFFTERKKHVKELLNTLQMLYQMKLVKPNGKVYKNIIISMPPRHGKSYSLLIFAMWIIGNYHVGVVTVSYSRDVASDFSQDVRDYVENEDEIDLSNFLKDVENDDNTEQDRLTFLQVFDVKLRKGRNTASQWAIEGCRLNYLGTSFNGKITGKGFKVGIIDDPIKNAYEAFNARVKDFHIHFYKNTFLSRVERGFQIINHTRWALDDLAGWLIENFKDDFYLFIRSAYNEDTGEMLCDDILNKEEYDQLKKVIDPYIFKANYDQKPISEEGKLYNGYQTYKEKPEKYEVFKISDLSFSGSDALASVVFAVPVVSKQIEGRYYKRFIKKAYVLDLVYIQQKGKLEFKTNAEINSILMWDPSIYKVEGQAGGDSFALSVNKAIQGKSTTKIIHPHQKLNKVAKIKSKAYDVEQRTFFPQDFEQRFPEFSKIYLNFEASFTKTDADDVPDVLSEVQLFIDQLPE